MPGDYTAGELMVVSAAREIQDGEVVFVGMRLPLLAFALAKRTHAPRAVGLFENGVVRDQPAAAPLYTISDGPNVSGALWCTRMVDVLGLLHQGAVDVGFIGGAQMDRFGNLNTSYILDGPRGDESAGGVRRLTTKLPGGGGAADIASLSRRLLIIMQHERRRFTPRVDYVTSPGFGDGGDWRIKVGLPRGGPAAAITTLGVLRFHPETREVYLDSYHPGTSVEEVQENTGWDLLVGEDVRETPPPTMDELRIIREYDPERFWTR